MGRFYSKLGALLLSPQRSGDAEKSRFQVPSQAQVKLCHLTSGTSYLTPPPACQYGRSTVTAGMG
jgi:hypothetical protein